MEMMGRECDYDNAIGWFHRQYCSVLCICPFHPCFYFDRNGLCG